MKVNIALVAAFAIVVPPLRIAPVHAEPSACVGAERTVWSCNAGRKQYALCASPDLGSATGYLQYRVMAGGKPEFVFPSPPVHPHGLFALSLAPRGANLVFHNAGYEYSIYEPLIGKTVINVAKGQRDLPAITCGTASDTLTLTKTQQFFKEVGIFE